MTDTPTPLPLPVIGFDAVDELALLGNIAAQRAEFARELNHARDRYMTEPAFRARVSAVKRALLDDEGGYVARADHDRALDNALRAIVVSDAATRPRPRARGRIAVLAGNDHAAREVALAAGIDLAEVIPYTPHNIHKTEGVILRGAVIAPDMAVRLANGHGHAYDTLVRLRRDLAKAGLHL